MSRTVRGSRGICYRRGSLRRQVITLGLCAVCSAAPACGGKVGEARDDSSSAGTQSVRGGTGGRDATGGRTAIGASGGQLTGGTGGTVIVLGGAPGTGATGGVIRTGGTGGVVPTGGRGPTGGTGAAGATGGTGAAGATGGAGGAGGTAATGGTGATGAAAGAAGQASAGECILAVPAELTELAGASFFDHPWPSDFRRAQDGSIDLSGFPNPRPSDLLSSYIAQVDDALFGFSPAAAGYLRFTAPLDPATLPADPMLSVDPSSSVQLIDVDAASVEFGERRPISVAFRSAGDGYWPNNTLAFMPMPGLPLRANTRYALVVTDEAQATAGELSMCEPLRQLLGMDPAPDPVAALRSDWGEAIEVLAEAGLGPESIRHLSVFTTNDPTQELQQLGDWVVQSYPPPGLEQLVQAEQTAAADYYEGTYGPSPDFQAGTPPFLATGGELAFGANAEPAVQREFDLRFVLSVPSAAGCTMPSEGFHLALYGHGTGGDYRSVVRSGVADLLATHCIATLGIDQIFHGTRPGGPCDAGAPDCNPLDESFAAFNAANPASMRGSNRQAAIDIVQLARLVTETGLSVPAAVSRTGQQLDFDPTRLLMLAHSQGATNGPLALAVDDQLLGAVLSGSAAMASISLLERTLPQDLGALIAGELFGPGSDERVDEFHPAMSLVQTNLDVGDPLHYASFIVTAPRAGFAPKSVLMIEGVGADGTSDSYVSSRAIEIHAIAVGLPPVAPLVWSSAELGWSNLVPVTVPAAGLAGNLAGGAASGALVQWEPAEASDAHFVFFDIPEAHEQAASFLAYLAADRVGRVPAR